MICGSPHEHGTTRAALDEMIKVFDAEGVESEIVFVGKEPVYGCLGCASCMKTGECFRHDIVNELSKKFEAADGLVIASPVYYASPNGALIAVLDRLFYSSQFDVRGKAAASVAVARRGGVTTTWDVLNKYITYGGMAVATGQYWNGLYGKGYDQAQEDLEGLQQMRTLARNMVFLMKSLALGKEKFGLPEKEPILRTNFVR
jgi:multimeric flavodoxin WrbA